MSIAWASVVVLVLLLPGFCFVAGFYLPEHVTRESAPVSPLGQLAFVVGVAFFLHAVFYGVINQKLCPTGAWGTSCIKIEQFVPILRLEAPRPLQAPADKASKESGRSNDLAEIDVMLDRESVRVLYYFSAISFLGLFLGFVLGKLIESGPLRRLARHQWIFPLLRSRASHLSGKPEKTRDWVTATVLSKTGNDGIQVLYVGSIADFFVKADGTFSHVVLRNVIRKVLKTAESPPEEPSAKHIALRITPEPMQFLFLTSDDVANVYFEKAAVVAATKAEDDRLKRGPIIIAEPPPKAGTEKEKSQEDQPPGGLQAAQVAAPGIAGPSGS